MFFISIVTEEVIVLLKLIGEKLLGTGLVVSMTSNGSDIKDIIPKLILGCYRKPESNE